MVVENTMYQLLSASDDDNNASFGIDLSNGSNYAGRNSSLNADTDGDEESVVAEENKNQMQEDEEQIISLVISKKSMIHAKSKSKMRKGTPPASITKIGTYYRVINLYFDEIHCTNVAKLGSAPSISKLDCRQFLHKNVYDCHLETYSDVNNNNNNNDWLAFGNHYFDDVGDSQNAANDFDQDLTSLEFKQTMEYINFHYQIAHQNNKKSGSHDEFHCFVGSHPYFL
jgi:hypothetical protein